MEQINTYVINLKRSPNRRLYMQELLGKFDFLRVNFIEAVDGRLLSESEVSELYDDVKATKRYGRSLNACEVGCAQSHRKCWEAVLSCNSQYSLILEDDVSIIEDLSVVTTQPVIGVLDRECPIVICLSGDFWFWRKKKSLCRLFDASGAYAYLINKQAASLLLSTLPVIENVADEWDLYRRIGINLYGLNPHVVDANIAGIPSDINQSVKRIIRSKMSLKNVMLSYQRAIVKRILYYSGHFHSKIRKPNFGIVDKNE